MKRTILILFFILLSVAGCRTVNPDGTVVEVDRDAVYEAINWSLLNGPVIAQVVMDLMQRYDLAQEEEDEREQVRLQERIEWYISLIERFKEND